MKILFLADEESKMYWEYFKKEDFKGIDIIVSCGDLNPSYLSFLTTMVGVPLLYVHGNHDDKYNVKPPEGCICIEDEIYEYEGVRFLGLGGSNRYKPGENQYTQKEMTKRVKKGIRSTWRWVLKAMRVRADMVSPWLPVVMMHTLFLGRDLMWFKSISTPSGTFI